MRRKHKYHRDQNRELRALSLREVTAEEAEAFLRGEDFQDLHVCGDPDCIVPRPAPHKRPPAIRNDKGEGNA